MRLCSDVASLKRLAERKEDENWRFRDFLRASENGIDAGELDRTVHRIFAEEAAQFDCKTCANCCKDLSPRLGPGDIERLSGGTGIPADQLLAGYLARDEEYGGYKFSKSPCPFLQDNCCTCYESRPLDCASYPHLHKDGFHRRLANMVGNCAVCPVVFNVFERLKIEMKSLGWDRHTYGRGRR